MKKTLLFAALLSAVSSSAMAESKRWIYQSDSNLDGNIVAAFEATFEGAIFSNSFSLVNKDWPDTGHLIGNLEPGSVTEIGSGNTPRITMKMSTATTTLYFLGNKTGDDQYQGVWYDADGLSGDFLLKPDTAPPPPTTTMPAVTISASTELMAPHHYPASAAIDGILESNTTNVWFTKYGDPDRWLQLDLGSAQHATYYRLSRGYCESTNHAYLPATWIVEGSNDETNWTTVSSELTDQSVNLPLASCDTFSQFYQIQTPDHYRYYRFTFGEATGHEGKGVAVGEIEIWK